MKLNKQKRIGEIVIVLEGENPENEILTHIFMDILGYSVSSCPRSTGVLKEFEGHDIHSKVILINAPTSNINSIADVDFFSKYLFEMSVKLNIDFTNDDTYIIFDRDYKNNKKKVLKKMLEKYNSAQGEFNEEQNGLLLINYPSIEPFVMSLFEKDSYKINKCRLGSENKDCLAKKGYKLKDSDENCLLNAAKEFLSYLKDYKIIQHSTEVYDTQTIGLKIFEEQSNKLQVLRNFNCLSQVIQILIDLGIVEL